MHLGIKTHQLPTIFFLLFTTQGNTIINILLHTDNIRINFLSFPPSRMRVRATTVMYSIYSMLLVLIKLNITYVIYYTCTFPEPR